MFETLNPINVRSKIKKKEVIFIDWIEPEGGRGREGGDQCTLEKTIITSNR